MTSIYETRVRPQGFRVPSFLSSAVLIILVLLTALCGSCGKGNSLPALNIDQAYLEDGASGSFTTGASYDIPRKTIVTSSSVVSYDVILRIASLSQPVKDTFDGTIFGGASFIPLDAEFDREITLRIPAGSAAGTVDVYYSRPTATSQVSWMLWGPGTVDNGTVEIATTMFGHYLTGQANVVLLPDAPTGLMASDGLYADMVRLVWNQSAGATGYKIFRDSQAVPVFTVGVTGTWDDMYDPHNQGTGETLSVRLPAVADTDQHTYWLKATNAYGDSGFSNADTGYVALHDQGTGSDI